MTGERISSSARRGFTTDSHWWRHRASTGDTVIAGSPLRLFRFAPGARPLLATLESQQFVDLEDLPPGSDVVLDRLIEADAIHPFFAADDQPSVVISDLTVVIPTKDTDLSTLVRLVDCLPPARRIIIVDDGSAMPVSDISSRHGDRVIVHRIPTSRGPAAARNVGAALAESSVICFIDSDIELSRTAQQSTFWFPLLHHFDDSRVGLIAPRVQSTDGSSVLDRYEKTDSPLDMGSQPARVHPRGRLSYVPSALMLIRTDVLRRQGGFDETLRYGEDVDLVWRLIDSGIVCRYEPRVTVRHRPRVTWSELGRQRFLYGTSAARLEARHPGYLAPLRLQSWTALAWWTGLCGLPAIASMITAASVVRLHRSIAPAAHDDSCGSEIITARLSIRGNLLAGQAVAQAISRTWWPIVAALSLRSSRTRRLWLLSILVPNIWRWRQRQSQLDPARYIAAKVFDDLSYGAGVWSGVIKTRRFGALRPRLME